MAAQIMGIEYSCGTNSALNIGIGFIICAVSGAANFTDLGRGTYEESKKEDMHNLFTSHSTSMSFENGNLVFARGLARWVRLGDLNLAETSDDARPQEFSVVDRLRHPGFKTPSHYNDIALLKLNRDAVFSGYVRPACLHTSLDDPTNKAVATGWGLVEWTDDTGSNDLMKVSLPFVPTAQCNNSYKSLFGGRKLSGGILGDSMVCAGEKLGGKDTCQGDSGGPLQLVVDDPYCMYSVVGVTSFGTTVCGARNSPAVYTRVAHFVPWIEKIVWP
uniref:Peptidase S1 domain-containing protein n=1 Tax=Timema bartmani TaxID=61472 RepID=A0A7R9FBU4_9NEOP|nr:unnamed protein product [Timema bartmani]